MRMHSDKPKSLQQIGGKPMLHYIVDCARNVGFDRIHVVYGTNGQDIPKMFAQEDINWVLQAEALGTGHAALQAIPHVMSSSVVCILYGDNPFIDPKTISRLTELAKGNSLALLTTELKDPTGYGRIRRNDDGKLQKIVEHKDADENERKITEVNVGPLAAPARLLKEWLTRLDNRNNQREFYLPDIVDFAVSDGIKVSTGETLHRSESSGVNNRFDQAQLERIIQLNRAKDLMHSGVQIADPARFDLRGECRAGKDCQIDVNVVLEGNVNLENNVVIEANNVIRNSNLGDGVTILPNCVIEGAKIEEGCTIGPYARIRPGTKIGRNCKVGNFVEIKNSEIGEGSKVNHLAYIGDSEIGKNVNFGAGSITCNYDGQNKHRTRVGDDVFIGSNVSLVAPLEIGSKAVIGAGSTITKDVEPGQAAVERSNTRVVPANRLISRIK